jgi:hypothetical protein
MTLGSIVTTIEETINLKFKTRTSTPWRTMNSMKENKIRMRTQMIKMRTVTTRRMTMRTKTQIRTSKMRNKIRKTKRRRSRSKKERRQARVINSLTSRSLSSASNLRCLSLFRRELRRRKRSTPSLKLEE